MNIEIKFAFMFFFLIGLTGFLWSFVTCIFNFIEKWSEFNLIGKIIIILALLFILFGIVLFTIIDCMLMAELENGGKTC